MCNEERHRQIDNELVNKHRRIVEIEMAAKEHRLPPPINEMAIPLKKFLEKIEGLQYEIVRNWCLCKWCQLFNPGNENFNHWKDGLCTVMNQIKLPMVKNKIDKRKHLHRILLEESEFNDPTMVYATIIGKFEIDEHIEDKHQLTIVARECAVRIDEIVDALANNKGSIESYVNSITS